MLGSTSCRISGKVEDIREVIEYADPSGVAIASLLHYDNIAISEIKEYLRSSGIKVSR